MKILCSCNTSTSNTLSQYYKNTQERAVCIYDVQKNWTVLNVSPSASLLYCSWKNTIFPSRHFIWNHQKSRTISSTSDGYWTHLIVFQTLSLSSPPPPLLEHIHQRRQAAGGGRAAGSDRRVRPRGDLQGGPTPRGPNPGLCAAGRAQEATAGHVRVLPHAHQGGGRHKQAHHTTPQHNGHRQESRRFTEDHMDF